MALVLADRVKVTTTTTGTGTVALGAAQAGYQDFSVLSDGDTTYYCIVDNATGAWEVGLGTYASAGPSLARTSVIASSTGTAVSFGAGPKDVFITLPADRVVTTDGADFSGPVTVPAGATGDEVPQAQEIYGKSQTEQTVTRISGVTYTNPIGKPMVVTASAVSTNTDNGLSGTRNGTVVVWSSWPESGADLNIEFTVFPGDTYSIIAYLASDLVVREYR